MAATIQTVREALIYLAESGLVTSADLWGLLAELYHHIDLTTAIRHLLMRKNIQRTFGEWSEAHPRAYFHALYQREQIHVLTVLDESYPAQLKEIHHAPPVLFVKGHVEWLSERSLAVVGCRDNTAYGATVIQPLLAPVVAHYPIVSGLAKGIDGLSHRTAIANGGRTIGVIGTGLGMCYPKQHTALQRQMEQSQCVVTGLPYHAGVRKWHFPYRNQIIAGLAAGTLVIEAKMKSGSLITANYALQYNRDVMAVPGNLTAVHSAGCNALLHAGATPITSGQDILDVLAYHL